MLLVASQDFTLQKNNVETFQGRSKIDDSEWSRWSRGTVCWSDLRDVTDHSMTWTWKHSEHFVMAPRRKHITVLERIKMTCNVPFLCSPPNPPVLLWSWLISHPCNPSAQIFKKHILHISSPRFLLPPFPVATGVVYPVILPCQHNRLLVVIHHEV